MEKSCPSPSSPALDHPYANLPQLPASVCPGATAPNEEECLALWEKYAMFTNVRRHSLKVAHIATTLAERAYELGFTVNVETVQASAMLHDIAKTWCVKNGGSHAMLGASWANQETRNFQIAQGVALHVHWPWPLPEDDTICSLPFFIIYADKRVRHDQAVSLDERFEDLIVRYGKTAEARAGIANSCRQAKEIEKRLSTYLEWNLHENTFDSRRLVQRT